MRRAHGSNRRRGRSRGRSPDALSASSGGEIDEHSGGAAWLSLNAATARITVKCTRPAGPGAGARSAGISARVRDVREARELSGPCCARGLADRAGGGALAADPLAGREELYVQDPGWVSLLATLQRARHCADVQTRDQRV